LREREEKEELRVNMKNYETKGKKKRKTVRTKFGKEE
jgi:hypothetical protein